MKKIGLSPLNINESGTLLIVTTSPIASAEIASPTKLSAMKSATIYISVANIFVRGSRRWITDSPG